MTVMNTKGKVLARIGRESYGDQSGRFYSPHGIAVDSKGDLYVAEVSWTDYGRHMDPLANSAPCRSWSGSRTSRRLRKMFSLVPPHAQEEDP